MRILFTGGGSGGHIFPIIAIARAIREMPEGKDVDLVFVGPCKGMKEEFSRNGIVSHNLYTGKVRRYLSLRTLVDAPLLLVGLVQSYWHLLWSMPDIVFSKGGFGAFPVVLVAWTFRIPIIVHESDSVAGLTNRLMGRFCSTIITSFPGEQPELPSEKLVRLGNPVRDLRPRKGGRRAAGEKATLLVLGGSQGAQQINELIFQSLATLTERYEIIHQAGEKNLRNAQEAHTEMPARLRPSYHPEGFLDEDGMRAAFVKADLVISRAGSGSIFEVALVGKPSILIPLASSAAGHQQENALRYERTGACIVLDPALLKPAELIKAIDVLMKDEARRSKMARAARSFARPNAASEIAKTILSYGKN